MRSDFRRVLKAATREDHARLDARMSAIDLRAADGFVRFLSIHQGCFRQMRGLAAPRTLTWQSLDDMVQALEADLASMGAAPAPTVPCDAPRVDGLAMDYVIEGSRLGTKVLRRNWLGASDPAVRRASAYFSLVPTPGRWHEICEKLSELPADGARARAIIEDTRMLFSLFYTAVCAPVSDHHEGKELAS